MLVHDNYWCPNKVVKIVYGVTKCPQHGHFTLIIITTPNFVFNFNYYLRLYIVVSIYLISHTLLTNVKLVVWTV